VISGLADRVSEIEELGIEELAIEVVVGLVPGDIVIHDRSSWTGWEKFVT
jgi:hypothetical protein